MSDKVEWPHVLPFDTLNYKLQISFEPGTKLTEFSSKFGINASTGISLTGETPEVIFFFPSEGKKSREMMIFLKEFGAVEQGGVWKMRREISESMDLINLIQNLVSIKSVVLAGFWLTKGEFRIDFIFHGSDLMKISNTLNESLDKMKSMQINHLSAGEQFKDLLFEIQEKLDLAVIEVEVTPPEEDMQEQYNPLGDSWTQILKVPFGYRKVSGIYFVEEEPKTTGGVNVIVENALYQTDASNRYDQLLSSKMNDHTIVPMFRIHRFNRPICNIITILPSLFATDFLKVFASTLEKMDGWKPVLTSFTSLKTWVQKMRF